MEGTPTQAATAFPSQAPTSLFDDSYAEGKDLQTLKNTCRIYGPLFACIFVAFCFARLRFPRVYNVRGWLERLQCDLAKDQYGLVSWIWHIFQIRESQLLDQCGMDALCLLRTQHIGVKLSFFGMLLSVCLLPVYSTSPWSESTAYITDPLVRLTVANVPEQSMRLLATVVAAYLLFGYACYLILQEFKWFTINRVHFLVQRKPRNYTVYVREIHEDYRNDEALADYFRHIFSHDAVLEAHVALSLPRLEQKVEERRLLVEKLEHAYNVQRITGETPQHRIELLREGNMVNSIDIYERELEEMNRSIDSAITRIGQGQVAMSPTSKQRPNYHSRMSSIVVGRMRGGDPWKEQGQQEDANTENGDEPEDKSSLRLDNEVSWNGSDSDRGLARRGKFLPSTAAVTHLANKVRTTSHNLSEVSLEVSTAAVAQVAKEVKTRSHKLSDLSLEAMERTRELVESIVKGTEDGAPLSAGFVTFTTLSAATVSKQMLHSNVPFQMEVEEAPIPEGIAWINVGRPHSSIQIGKLLSFGIAAALCFFWTIPVSFFLSLTEVEALKTRLEFLEDWIRKAPWLESLLYQLAPIMVWVLGEIMYVIVDIVATLEGHIGVSALEVSKFRTLSAFHLIQTFFVASVAGSLSASLSKKMLEEPKVIVEYLGTTLPPQSTFFIQYMLINTTVGLLFEMLRITQLWQERLRRRIWWNLTEKEQNRRWKLLRPLGNPRNFFHARVFAADAILYFMILFVYTCLAPITCYFLFFCFMVQSAAFRHQFIYIYPPSPDSGGRLWLSSIYIMIACMVVAEITLLGYFLLKETRVCASLMIPLIILTALFAVYIKQRHFRTAIELSSEDCIQYDSIYAERGLDFDFVRGKYRHPAMKDKELLPDNAPSDSNNGAPHSNDDNGAPHSNDEFPLNPDASEQELGSNTED